ncbi:uncharacterized protein NEMAJ01_0498 [Nematocida major]|uniref:uncharacterized protein n=1 Tax=Nematocida major TaxID=1912982 RepID=UPI002007D089|nr:uncharacterized protein NEMAJ01_0498 [Nematocida major]KAH9385602.1 hypothetical protein NEMAJ01_0498 [Nematocida major]
MLVQKNAIKSRGLAFCGTLLFLCMVLDRVHCAAHTPPQGPSCASHEVLFKDRVESYVKETTAVYKVMREINRRNLLGRKKQVTTSCRNYLLNPPWTCMQGALHRPDTMSFFAINEFDTSTTIGLVFDRDVLKPRSELNWAITRCFHKKKSKPAVSFIPKDRKPKSKLLSSLAHLGNAFGLIMLGFVEYPLKTNHMFALDTNPSLMSQCVYDYMTTEMAMPKANTWHNMCVIRNSFTDKDYVRLEYRQEDSDSIASIRIGKHHPLLRTLLFVFSGGHLPESVSCSEKATERIYTDPPIESDREIHVEIVRCVQLLASTYAQKGIADKIEKVAEMGAGMCIFKLQAMLHEAIKNGLTKKCIDALVEIFQQPEQLSLVTVQGDISHMHLFEYSKDYTVVSKNDPGNTRRPRAILENEDAPYLQPLPEKASPDAPLEGPLSSAPEQDVLGGSEGMCLSMWNDPSEAHVVWVQVEETPNAKPLIIPYHVQGEEFREILQYLMCPLSNQAIKETQTRCIAYAMNQRAAFSLAYLDLLCALPTEEHKLTHESAKQVMEDLVKREADLADRMQELRKACTTDKNKNKVYRVLPPKEKIEVFNNLYLTRAEARESAEIRNTLKADSVDKLLKEPHRHLDMFGEYPHEPTRIKYAE